MTSLRAYENTLVLNPKLEEESIGKTIQKFGDIIQKYGGEVERVDKWGLRRLAYPIGRHNDGYYAIVYFKGEAKLINELDRVLRITDEVIRYMIVKAENIVSA